MTVFLTIWFLLTCVAGLAWYLHKQGYGVSATDTHIMVTKTEPQKKLPAKSEDWDEEFLRSEAAKHSLDRIEEDKLIFKFSKDKEEQVKNGGFDGFTWYCTCKKIGHGLNLEGANRTFDKHQRDEREKALAQLGRFK